MKSHLYRNLCDWAHQKYNDHCCQYSNKWLPGGYSPLNNTAFISQHTSQFLYTSLTHLLIFPFFWQTIPTSTWVINLLLRQKSWTVITVPCKRWHPQHSLYFKDSLVPSYIGICLEIGSNMWSKYSHFSHFKIKVVFTVFLNGNNDKRMD